MIKIEVQSTRAVIRSQEPLTVGLRGAKVHFTFGQDWESLTKTAVFRQADKTVAVTVDPETVIPWEVLTMPGVPIQIGVYGVNSTGTVAIPTVWVVTQPVRPGTDPEADPALEPTPGLWEQMQGKLTELVAALENAQAPVYTVTVRKNEDGSYWADKSPEDRADAYLAGKMLMCHWSEYNLLLPLSHTSGRRTFVFRTVKDGYEYCVEMTEDIQCTRKALEAEAPVRSVNGQTGDVVLPTPLKVTVSLGTEGAYFADTDPDFIQEALDHNRTLVCCWQEENVMLPLTSFRQGGPYSFTAVTGEQEYTVTIYDTENIACTVTKLSPEAVLYTPQELTPEQQAQARENLGIDQLLPGDANQETVLVDFTASEPVSLVDIPLSEEQVKAIANANVVSYRLTLFGDETATDTTGLGTAQLRYWCNQDSGWQLGSSLLSKTANAVASAENKKWAVGNYNGFILQSPFINNSDIGKHTNSHHNYPLILVGGSAGTEVKQVTKGGSVLSTSKNVSLRLETSLPIGTGSRMILTIR